MTPGSNYRMSRSAKTVVANLWNNPNRGAIRKSIIQGELYNRVNVKQKRENNSTSR